MADRKRPSLTAVLGSARAEPAKEGNTTGSLRDDKNGWHDASVDRPAKRIGRRRQGYAQLNVLVPTEMRKEAKVRALMEERDISEIVAKLLDGWLTGHIDV